MRITAVIEYETNAESVDEAEQELYDLFVKESDLTIQYIMQGNWEDFVSAFSKFMKALKKGRITFGKALEYGRRIC